MKKLLSALDLSYLYAFLGEATLALTLLFYVLLARVLGPEQYGIFASASALGAILSLLISLGFPDLLTREVARSPEEGTRSTVHILAVEGAGALLVLVVLFPLTQLLGIQDSDITIFYLVIFAEVSRSVVLTLRSLLKGLGQFKTEMIVVVIERFLVVACSVTVLLLTRSLFWVMLTFTLTRFVHLLGFFRYLSSRLSLWSPLNFQRSISAFKEAFPLALSGVLWIIFYQADILMLEAMSPAGEAGLYSASYRIMEIFSALYRVVFYVSFTRLSQSFAINLNQMHRQIYKTTLLLTLGILPIVLLAGVFQSSLVVLIYDETYKQSVQSLAVLLPSITVIIFGELARYVIVATKQDRFLPPLLLGAVVLNVMINLALIPSMGGTGAAIATLVSEAALTIVCLQFLIKMGYQRMGWSVSAITVLGLFVTALPSLILNDLVPSATWVLAVVCVGAIALLIRPQHFLKNTIQS
jgi:O-antigen/teichoic acid export membrane protein